MENKPETTRGKMALGVAIVGLGAGAVGAMMCGFGMMAIGVQPAPMNLIGAFGFVTIGFITVAVIGAEIWYFR
jgi:hypothetical protein